MKAFVRTLGDSISFTIHHSLLIIRPTNIDNFLPISFYKTLNLAQ